jgi:leader peptidase (prepilin peptidase) / N-methyltransferase
MEKIILIVLGGMIWGSFLNVVIFRVPRKISLIRPPSTCPSCQTRIRFHDNIPVFSYIWLRGRCRRCGVKIPFSYVLVEILTPAAFIILHGAYGLSIHFFASCLFASALIVLAFIDYRLKILPDWITYPAFALGLVYSLFRKDFGILQALLGAAVGAGFLLVIYGGYYLLRKKEGLGMGDVIMMLMVGAYLGWLPTLLTLILASFVGSLVGVSIILIKRKNMQYMLPYGTFLAPAAFVSLVWGEKIISAYLSFFRR